MPSSPSIFARIPDTESTAAVLDLNGPWQFKATDERAWLPAVVPGVVHSDLLRAGRLEDPLLPRQRAESAMGREEGMGVPPVFPRRRGFPAARPDRPRLPRSGHHRRCLLNGRLLARTRNMFVEHEFDVKACSWRGRTKYAIVFRSILDWNREGSRRSPGSPGTARTGWTTRKARPSSSANAGRTSAGTGASACSPAAFGGRSGLRPSTRPGVTDLLIRQDLTRSDAGNPATARAPRAVRGRGVPSRTAGLCMPARTWPAPPPRSRREVRTRLAVERPRLWWPNGLGEQPLYTVEAPLKAGERAVHARRARIGLRTVELVQEKDERGQTFGFKINGTPGLLQGRQLDSRRRQAGQP